MHSLSSPAGAARSDVDTRPHQRAARPQIRVKAFACLVLSLYCSPDPAVVYVASTSRSTHLNDLTQRDSFSSSASEAASQAGKRLQGNLIP